MGCGHRERGHDTLTSRPGDAIGIANCDPILSEVPKPFAVEESPQDRTEGGGNNLKAIYNMGRAKIEAIYFL